MRTDACSVAITGTTVALEVRAGRNKLYVLEGHARMSLRTRPNESAAVGPGQLLDVPRGATSLPAVQNFDINQFMSTNPLITDFPPLPSRDLIYTAGSNPAAGSPISPGPGVVPPGAPFLRPPFMPPLRGGGRGNDSPGRNGNRPGRQSGSTNNGASTKPNMNSADTSGAVVGRPVSTSNAAAANSANGTARRSPTPPPRKRKR
jgi:hypothetical protein